MLSAKCSLFFFFIGRGLFTQPCITPVRNYTLFSYHSGQHQSASKGMPIALVGHSGSIGPPGFFLKLTGPLFLGPSATLDHLLHSGPFGSLWAIWTDGPRWLKRVPGLPDLLFSFPLFKSFHVTILTSCSINLQCYFLDDLALIWSLV